MKPIKVAVLEDHKAFLKELLDNLKRTGLVNIVVAELESEPFIEKVREKQPEALLLDIHLKDESITGIQVAEILKLPVLFLSAARRDYLESIDNLKLLGKFPVEEIGKIPDTDKLQAILKTFIPRVLEYQKTQRAVIKPKGEEEKTIYFSDVAFIETIKGEGNHKIFFFSQKPIETADSTFGIFRDKGFTEDKFYKLGKSLLFNIATTTYENGYLTTAFKNEKGDMDTFKQVVPPEKKTEVKDIFLRPS